MQALPAGLCVVALALLVPCGARGQDMVAAKGARPSERPARSWKAIPDPEHKVVLETASGFGVFATVRGRAVDATSPDRLVNGPNGSLFDQSAGLGWRRDRVSAMVGYMRPSSDRPEYQDQSISYHRPRGRFGIGLSLHY